MKLKSIRRLVGCDLLNLPEYLWGHLVVCCVVLSTCQHENQACWGISQNASITVTKTFSNNGAKCSINRNKFMLLFILMQVDYVIDWTNDFAFLSTMYIYILGGFIWVNSDSKWGEREAGWRYAARAAGWNQTLSLRWGLHEGSVSSTGRNVRWVRWAWVCRPEPRQFVGLYCLFYRWGEQAASALKDPPPVQSQLC